MSLFLSRLCVASGIVYAGMNGGKRPVAVIGARVKRSLRKINLHNEAIL